MLLTLTVVSCDVRHEGRIDSAYHMVDVNPDSAISILDRINQKKLSKTERARFALVYTIAQDKSGLDVDDDSLLSIAYDHYRKYEGDTLFSKCMYYMGKCYALNSKVESAIECYEKAINASDRQGDRYIKSLALEKISVLQRETNPRKAVYEARQALETYLSIDNHSAINVFYYTLNLADAFIYADSLTNAEYECNNAIKIANTLKDSMLLSYAYQDKALVAEKQGKLQKALSLSKAAYNTGHKDNSKKINLASAYLAVDSTKECNAILNTIETNSETECYTLLYMRHIASMKNGEYTDAIVFADSAYKKLEQIYAAEQISKGDYYKKLAQEIVEHSIVEEKASFQNKLLILIIFVSVVVLSTILYSYRQYKEKVRLQKQKERLERDVEKRIHEEEIKRKDLQLAIQKAESQKELEKKMLEEDAKKKELLLEIHKAEAARELDKQIHEQKMRHREIQLATMRKYILSKIKISKKIEELKGNRDKPVCLTDEEWEEIRIFIDNTEENFVFRLKENFPELTDDDMKFMMLIRLNLPSKAMAQIYGISDKSICQKLFVYKSKVRLEKEEKVSLREFILNF